jgi:ABC-type branched-subunit amino acid transport system permease subunit
VWDLRRDLDDEAADHERDPGDHHVGDRGRLFALLVGYISLRRSGIYFSILTLAFAQMSYALAYSVLTPITGGETGLQPKISDPRILDEPLDAPMANPARQPVRPEMSESVSLSSGLAVHLQRRLLLAAFVMLIAFYISIRIFRSPFGMMLRAIKIEPAARMNYTGLNPALHAGGLRDLGHVCRSGRRSDGGDGPQVGPSGCSGPQAGEVVLMTILGGAGTLIGPVLGAGMIKYMENIISKINDRSCTSGSPSCPTGWRTSSSR